MPGSNQERTLAIVKPDAVGRGLTGEIVARYEKAGLKLLGMRMVRLSEADARGFYAVHRERPFYESLCRFMSSGPAVVLALEGDGAIRRLRDLMGATNPAEAAEGTIRRAFGTDIERNAVHGSDSPQTAAVEIPFFFSDLDLPGGRG